MHNSYDFKVTKLSQYFYYMPLTYINIETVIIDSQNRITIHLRLFF